MPAVLNLYETVGNSTWTKPSDSVLVEVVVVSGGAGGGSGVNQIGNQDRSGGGGGGGGGLSRVFILAADVAGSAIAQVGAAGTGGARQTTGSTGGITGGAGGDSAFYNGANLYGRSTGGGGGFGGGGGGQAGPGGAGGYGTWRGGDGATAPAGNAGSIPAIFQGANGANANGTVGGAGGGGGNSGGANFAGAPGRFSFHVANGTTHPTPPAGASGNTAPGNSVGVNSATRSLYGSPSGSSGAVSSGVPGTTPNAVPKGFGGSGGGVQSVAGQGSGNGGNGGLGAVYVISYPSDADVRQGTVRSSVAVTGTSASGRRAAFATRADLTAMGLTTGTSRRSGAATSPMAVTSLLTHRQGSARADLTVIGIARSGPLKGARAELVVTGTAAGTAKRAATVRSPLVVVGVTQLRRVISGQVRSPLTVIGTVRARRFILITPPCAAEYLDRPYQSHYHQGPTRTDYLVRPVRATYDDAVAERLTWMAGQLRGSIRCALTDANGPLPGLASAISVKFTARRQSDGGGLINAFATVESAVNAIVRYDPVPGDFALPGPYAVQWVVHHSGDLPQCIPDDGYDQLDVLEPLVPIT